MAKGNEQLINNNYMKKLFEKIRERLQEVREWRIKRNAIRKLIHDYEINYQVELLLEQWIVKSILNGSTERRKELAGKQSRIKEMAGFINYLKTQ